MYINVNVYTHICEHVYSNNPPLLSDFGGGGADFLSMSIYNTIFLFAYIYICTYITKDFYDYIRFNLDYHYYHFF
jgi:hypothetical protein